MKPEYERTVRMNVTIPYDLYQRYLKHKDRVNVSKLLTNALDEEMDMIEMVDDRFWSRK